MFDTISLIGLGYIGLPTATLFASRKKRVIGVDISPHVVDVINRGQIHIVEPELDILVHAAVTEGYLRATVVPEPADAFLIAVPTPFTEGHKADLSYVRAAAAAIAPVLRHGNLVVLESTSPVGTTESLARWLADARPDLRFLPEAGNADVHIAYCPERVLPGRVVHELVANDRIIGGITATASALAVELYETFVQGECMVTTARTAEMCKLTENSFRDVNIAFANELSLVCDKLRIDVWELIRLANRHPRVQILQPGAGVGGHCIAVDPWFIVERTPEEARLIRTAREVNDSKPDWVVQQIRAAADSLGAGGKRVRIALLGLSFKPNIDDLRESPALHIAMTLSAMARYELMAVEPNIRSLPPTASGMTLASLDEAIDTADVVALLVGHETFRGIGGRLHARQRLVDVVGLTS